MEERIMMKPLTLYVSEGLYQEYQLQAGKTGRKAAELIREAMEEYAEDKFVHKNKLSSLNFDYGVRLKKGSKDFLNEDWRSDFLDDQVKL